MKRHLQALPAWMLTIVTVLAILWLTLAPKPLGEEDLPMFPGADKLAHGLMFGFLTFVGLLDWARGRNFRSVHTPVIFTMAILSTLIGIGIEFAQRAMALGRSFDVMDIVADATGAFVEAIAWFAFEKTGANGKRKK